jgi:hypothetical protein
MQGWQQFTGGVLIIVVAAFVFRAAGLKDIQFGSAADWFAGMATTAAVVVALYQANEPARARAREGKAKAAARLHALHEIAQVCSAARQHTASARRIMEGSLPNGRQRAGEWLLRELEPVSLRWRHIDMTTLMLSERNMVPEIAAIFDRLPRDVDRVLSNAFQFPTEGDLYELDNAARKLEFYELHCRKKIDRSV